MKPDVLRLGCAGEQHEFRVGDTVIAEIVGPAGWIEDRILRAKALLDGIPGLFPAHSDAAFQHEISVLHRPARPCGLLENIRHRRSRVLGRAILYSNLAEQRHDIIRKRVALAGEESVSGVTGGSGRGVNQENPPMRIYIIGNDGITLCRETPTAVNEGEIAVASNAELHAAGISGKQLLALWNALPGVEKRRKVADRDALIDQLWSAIELLPDPEPQSDPKRRSKRSGPICRA